MLARATRTAFRGGPLLIHRIESLHVCVSVSQSWWTPSSALDYDCDGNKVTARTVLSKECIYEKKTAEIRARQAISAENAQYKVAKLQAAEEKAEKKAAERAAKLAEAEAKRAKYAAMAAPKR